MMLRRVALAVALVAVGAQVASAGSLFKKNITGIVNMVKECDACIAKAADPVYKDLVWRCPPGLTLQKDGKTCAGTITKSCDAPLSTVNGQCCASVPSSSCSLQTRACADKQYSQKVCHPSGVKFLFENVAANAINIAKGVAKGAQNQRLLPSLLTTDELGWPASEALAYHHVVNEQVVNPLIVVKKMDPVVILPEPKLSAIIPPPEVPPPNLDLHSAQPKLGIVLPVPKWRFNINTLAPKTPDLPLAPSHSPKVGVILPQPHLWMDAPDLTHYVQKPLIVTERQGVVLNLTGLSPKQQVVFQFEKNPGIPFPLPDPTSPVFFEQLWNFYGQPLAQKAKVMAARPSRTVIDLSKVSFGDQYVVTLPEWIKIPPQSYSDLPGPTSPNFVAAMIDAASNGHFALPDVYTGVEPVGVLFNLTGAPWKDSIKIEGVPPLEKKPEANTIVIDGTHGLAKLLPEKITVTGKEGDVSRTVVVVPEIEHAKDWSQLTVTKVPKDTLVTVEHGAAPSKAILVDFNAGGQLPEPRPHVRKNGTTLLFEIPHAQRGFEFTLPEKQTLVFETQGYDPEIVVVALNTTALQNLHDAGKAEKYNWLFALEAPTYERPADKTVGHGGKDGDLKITVVELPDDFASVEPTKQQIAFDLPKGKHGETAKLVATRCKGTAAACSAAVAKQYGLNTTALNAKTGKMDWLKDKKAGNLNLTIPAFEIEQQCAFKCCDKDAKVACMPQVKVPTKTPALPFCPEGCSVDLLSKKCKCGAFKVADCPAGYLPCGGLPPSAFCMKAGALSLHPKGDEVPVVAQCAGMALKCAAKGLETCAAKRKRMMM